MQDLAPRYRWVVFSLMAAAIATRVPVGVSLGVLLPEITATFGLGAVQQGWLGSAMNLGNVLLGVPAAWFFSRFNPSMLLGASSVLAALLVLAQGLAGSFWLLLATRVMTGLVFVAISPARTLLVQQWFPLREIVLISGIQIAVIGVVESATLSLTPLLQLQVGGWRNVLLTFGGVGLAVAALWVGLGRERPGAVTGQRTAAQEGSPMLVLLQRPALWILALGQFGAPAFWWAYATFWPSYMLDRYELPLTTSGFLFGLTSLGMAPAGLAVGWLSSRYPGLRRPLLWACGLDLCLTALAMLQTDSVPILLVVCMLGGFGWGFVALMSSLPFELPQVQPREVAVAASFLHTVGSLGGMFGPAMAGILIELWGGVLPALAVLSFLALGVSLSAGALPATRRTQIISEDP